MNTLQFDPGATGMTFTNHTGATIPPFGVFAVEEAEWDTDGFYTCHAVAIDATTVAGTNLFALNGGAAVPDGKNGRCFLAYHQAAWALVSPYLMESDVVQSDGNYVEIGPVDGSDYLSDSGAGFLVVGGKFTGGAIDGSRLLVIQNGSANPIKVVYIVEDIDGYTGGDPKAFASDFAGTITATCNSKPDGTGTEYIVYLRSEPGVWFTGQRIRIMRIKDERFTEPQWEVVGAGQNQWDALAAEDIIGNGDVTISYFDYRVSDVATITVDATLFNVNSPITSGDDCWVMHDESVGAFDIPGTVKFIVIPRNCPDYVLST